MALAPHLIALGSGQVAAAGAGNKAALLDRARRDGLPVPPGYVLLAEAEGRLRGAPVFRRKIAVRSAFSAEDHPWESLAGFFLSKLWVDPRDRKALAAALLDVWQSAERRAGEFRRDILMVEMVDALHAGVAFTEHDFEDDLVNWTRGTGERLVAGEENGNTLDLPKLRAGDKSRLAPTAAGFAPRLQALLRDVRRVFGAHDWEIEWADDGRTCWLLQLRPMTRALRRNEAFVPARLPEILPELPPRFTTSVLASCAKDMLAWFHRFDYHFPFERKFIEVVEGRPLVNLSLARDMARSLGLPTEVEAWNPRRVLRKWKTLLRLFLAPRGARAPLRRANLQQASFRAAVEEIRAVHSHLAAGLLLWEGVLGVLEHLKPLNWYAAYCLKERQTLIDESMRVLDRLRGSLTDMAEIAGVAGDELWMMSVEEAVRLDDGWRPSPTWREERQREMLRFSRCRLPAVVHRFDDFALYYEEAAPISLP